MAQTNIDNRINRLIGQIEGIARMIKAGRPAEDTVQQILAARQALSRIGVIILRDAIVKTPQRQKGRVAKMIEKIFHI